MRYFFLLLCALFLIVSCKKQTTIWDSDWTAPLVNDTLTLNKFVNDSTLSVSSSSYYELNLHRTLMDIDLAQIVSIPDTTISKTYVIPFQTWSFPPNSNVVNDITENELDMEGVELKKVRLSEGFVDVEVKNPIATKVYFTIILPGVTKDGSVFQQTLAAPQGTNANPGIVTKALSLAGYTIDLAGVSGGEFNILQSQFIIKTDPEGPTIVMTNQDVSRVSATFRDVKVDYARGYFGDRIISDTTETTVDILTKIKSGLIDFPSSSLSFTISNGLKIPAQATLSLISNENTNNGSIQQLNVTADNSFQFGQHFNLDPATGSWSSLVSSNKTIEFNALNSNMEQFLENLGAKEKIGYSIHLNPWGNSSGGWNEIFPNSRLKISIDVDMPLMLGLDGVTIKDTFDFDVKQNTEKTHVVSGELVLYATNAFPMSGDISLDLLDANGNVLYTIAGTQPLQSSLYGNTTSGSGLQTCLSTIHYTLSEDMITHLESIKKVAISAEFNTPNPQTGNSEQVIIPEGAFLGVKLKGGFKVENRY